MNSQLFKGSIVDNDDRKVASQPDIHCTRATLRLHNVRFANSHGTKIKPP